MSLSCVLVLCQADSDGSGAIDFEEFYGLWYSLTRPNEATLQEVKTILQRRCVLLAVLRVYKHCACKGSPLCQA